MLSILQYTKRRSRTHLVHAGSGIYHTSIYDMYAKTTISQPHPEIKSVVDLLVWGVLVYIIDDKTHTGAKWIRIKSISRGTIILFGTAVVRSCVGPRQEQMRCRPGSYAVVHAVVQKNRRRRIVSVLAYSVPLKPSTERANSSPTTTTIRNHNTLLAVSISVKTQNTYILRIYRNGVRQHEPANKRCCYYCCS